MIKKFIYTLLIILIFVPVLSATEYFVDKNHGSCSDSNAGTEAAPWCTIQQCNDEPLTAGDTCTIKAGTYNERVTNFPSGTSGNPITYQNYSSDTVTIDGTGIGLSYKQGLFHIGSANYIMVDGLRMTNSLEVFVYTNGSTGITLKNLYMDRSEASCLGILDNYNLLIDNCELRYCNNYNYDPGPPEVCAKSGSWEGNRIEAVDFEIKNSYIYNNSGNGSSMQVLDSENGLIHDNVFEATCSPKPAMGFDGGAYDQAPNYSTSGNYNIDVYNNYIKHHDAGGFSISIESTGGRNEDIRFFNNIIDDPVNNAFQFWEECDPCPTDTWIIKDIQIFNNTIYKAYVGIKVTLGMDVQGTTGAWNNIFSECTTAMNLDVDTKTGFIADTNIINGSTSESGTNPIYKDPKFVNAAGDDFKLQSDSPAINSANASYVPSDDYDGVSRPQDSLYDIGAYEFGSSRIDADVRGITVQ